MKMTDFKRGILTWSAAGRPYPGELESGDGHLVVESAQGWLLAVVDGLGHGSHAAEARRAFTEAILQHTWSLPAELFQICDKALRATRGCVGSLATIDRHFGSLSWFGVGNVEGVLLHEQSEGRTHQLEHIASRGGIVGYRLPDLRPSTLSLENNDTLILVTDGIRDDFMEWLNPALSPDQLATIVLNHCAKPTDDALVLVARWNERLPEDAE